MHKNNKNVKYNISFTFIYILVNTLSDNNFTLNICLLKALKFVNSKTTPNPLNVKFCALISSDDRTCNFQSNIYCYKKNFFDFQYNKNNYYILELRNTYF